MSVLPEQIRAVNIGLPMFADALREQGVAVEHVDWRIPAGGDLAAVATLSRLYGDHGSAIEGANAEVVRRLDSGVPQLVEVATVAQAVPAWWVAPCCTAARQSTSGRCATRSAAQCEPP